MSSADWFEVYRREVRSPVDTCHNGHEHRWQPDPRKRIRVLLDRIKQQRERQAMHTKESEF
jgi:hypothetical protein